MFLDDGPDYDALSYAWGNDNQVCKIAIDGIEHLITKNLHDALQALVSGDQLVRLLWVDALSINQADMKERSRQV